MSSFREEVLAQPDLVMYASALEFNLRRLFIGAGMPTSEAIRLAGGIRREYSPNYFQMIRAAQQHVEIDLNQLYLLVIDEVKLREGALI